MALSSSRLAGAIESSVRTALSLGATPYPQLTAFCTSFATEIVSEITGHAELSSSTATATGTTGGAFPLNTTPVIDVPGLSIPALAVTGGIS